MKMTWRRVLWIAHAYYVPNVMNILVFIYIHVKHWALGIEQTVMGIYFSRNKLFVCFVLFFLSIINFYYLQRSYPARCYSFITNAFSVHAFNENWLYIFVFYSKKKCVTLWMEQEENRFRKENANSKHIHVPLRSYHFAAYTLTKC